MPSEEESGDDRFQVLQTGGWQRFFWRLPRPAVAFGANSLYLVSLEGSEFSLTIGETTRPLVGFFTHRIVAAKTEDEAKLKACDAARKQWRDRGYAHLALKLPNLVVNEIERLDAWFRPSSGAGFTFHRGA